MPSLVHGTALVVGTTGLILVGPSGSGKSSLAVRLLAGALQAGHFAALVGDDQVFVDWINGRAIASAPETIRGMIELYGSGIGRMDTIGRAVLHFAVQPVTANSSNRVPEENGHWPAGSEQALPLHVMDRAVADPFAWLTVLISGFPIMGAFQV